MKIKFSTIIIAALLTISAYGQSEIDEWLSHNYNLINYEIDNTVLEIDRNTVKIAYQKIQPPFDDKYIGIFYRAVLFTETPYPQLVLFFNGPMIIAPDGARIYDFSQEEYRYINFYGWEIIPSNNERGMGIFLGVVTDEGNGRPDSINISYFEEYKRFGSYKYPFNYGYHFNANDPLFIGMARSGMPPENDDAYEYYLRNIEKMDADETRLLRNAVFALHGYKFRSVDLLEYFYQFNWYIPYIENSASIDLNEDQQRLIDYLLAN